MYWDVDSKQCTLGLVSHCLEMGDDEKTCNECEKGFVLD